jgi:hypothetical protein
LPNRFFADEWANYQDPATPNKQKVPKRALNEQYLNALDWHIAVDMLRSNDLKAMLALVERDTNVETNTVEWTHPMILGAKANSTDNPDWHSTMNGPDKVGYWKACETEINTLTKAMDAWEEVDREPWMNILPSTWAFKCKRLPDGSIKKLKARFCAQGDRQKSKELISSILSHQL